MPSIFDEVKGSENRAKYKEKSIFSYISEVHPIFDEVKVTKNPRNHQRFRGNSLLGLQISVFAGDVLDARAGLVGVQVVVAYDQSAGVTPVQILE